MGQVGEFCKHAIVLKLKQGREKKQIGFSSKLELTNVSYKKNKSDQISLWFCMHVRALW